MSADFVAKPSFTSPILIAGAGLAGLCLGQVLKKNSLPFKIFEKDSGPNVRDQGYRIHLDTDTVNILKTVMPADSFELFLSLSQPLGAHFTFWNGNKQLLAAIKTKANKAGVKGRGISRYSVRQLLLKGLEDSIEYGKAFRAYKKEGEQLEIFFEDGTSARGSFLIGCDGSGSAVAKNFQPQHRAMGTEAVYVIGKIPLSAANHALFPPAPFERVGIIFGKGGINLFLSEQLLTHRNGDYPERFPYLNEPKDFSVWSLVCRKSALTTLSDISLLSKNDIQRAVTGAVNSFHPDFVRVIQQTPKETLACYPVQSALNTGKWKTDPQVTIIGDAAHTMTPLQGKGANMALQDAFELGVLLSANSIGTDAFNSRLQLFEEAMRRRSSPAVRRSLQILNIAVKTGMKRRAFLLLLQAYGWVNVRITGSGG